jgi:hypothetical protein
MVSPLALVCLDDFSNVVMWLLSILPIGLSCYRIEKFLISIFNKIINFCKNFLFILKLQNSKKISDLLGYKKFNLGVIEPTLVIVSKVEVMTKNLCF